ncbi:RNA polymerase sigma (SigV) subunit [Melghiribacillus thermohalophilus]|uniref:RNA polymerase sigma (SigV) subunit n=2 Tax=Melghiribacillus thermohalophilus TaxID=1324956 RepID=A0A4R3MSQ6_9BACI|nr:RNA polymerase sigma (SigV) subunit [Melghiribacillus thermohalophilus]
MAYIYVKNKDDALDVVQEVAYRAFKMIHTLKEPKYFKTWLMRIAINCATDAVRKNKKIVQLKPEYEEFIGADSGDIPLTVTLHQLIDVLEEKEKSIVLLKFYQNLTFKEIADQLEIPLSTAKSVLYRALKKLRKQLKEAGIHE